MPVLVIRDLRARYSAKGPEILKGISFEVAEDDFFAIIGPSGAGKSTLIRCINRLVEPTSGEIHFNGDEITALGRTQLRLLRRDIGMIFQEFNLINRMSVMDNILSGRLGYTSSIRTLFKAFPREDIDHALRLLNRVGLSDHVDKRADQLSEQLKIPKTQALQGLLETATCGAKGELRPNDKAGLEGFGSWKP